ncbi:sulfite exporter TauE/SafE family protein, partial [bacterium]|nr:sulfite exporter TauE/SafE family protein [bacterium]
AFFAGPWAASMGEFFLRAFFLMILVVLLVITFLRRNNTVSDQADLVVSSLKKSFSIGLAIVAGFISSFTGIGAGVILSPIMFNLKMVRPKELVPTTNLSTMLTTFSGTMGYLLVDLKQQGELIQKPIALSLFVVATITGYFIRPYQGRISQPIKITILCCILLFIILKQAFELYGYQKL